MAFYTITKMKIVTLPKDINWHDVLAMGCIAGIGFTMSIFVTLLAFDDSTIINNAKFIILLSSLTAGIIGFLGLKLILKRKR